MKLQGKDVGFALTGSHCTLDEIFFQIEELKKEEANIYPVLSESVQQDETRFGKPQKWINELKKITDKPIIDSIVSAEPIGPENLLDILIIAPCTGNTMAKIANGIIDSTVVMAAKAQLRNEKPVLISISTNDALGLNFNNLSKLLTTENIYFVPFGQDNPSEKPNSLVSRNDLLIKAAEKAMDKEQLQPVLIEYKGI